MSLFYVLVLLWLLVLYIDLLQSRLRGKADPDSTFWTEFSTALGIFFFVPYLAIKKLFGSLQPRQIYHIQGA